ncbi:DUF2797 domain-containing protein [Halococcoides cellulosivorans]|uniref:DUF2797 domain-containing protein n=1 Tax=Halococcoides cellulosivorans TaxID=1679096 RepID=A0A2R4WYK2_9EURY|nr:DUF2797 domain-containing protein [Halococcoides cellulosivorans]AWB26627.1 DUF2797 domain-containing protein [Halococcoides cellulosivorans]
MQIVGYRARTDEPAALALASEGAVDRVPLAPGADLAYTLGPRRCAGRVEGDRHESCDRSAAPYCDRHTDRWPCARCTGDCALPLESCREPHAIYLAAFAPDEFKVGVTRDWRLETRLREQGADRAAHLRTVADGRRARQIEAQIAERIGDSVRVATKIDGLHRSVDPDAWETLLAAFDHEATYAFEYGVDLDHRPIRETVATGTVRATKGRVALLAAGPTTVAVDLRDLVGHEVTAERSDRRRQAALGAFE